MLSHFSHVQLFAILWTIAARLLYLGHSSSKNTGMGWYALLPEICLIQGSSLHLLCLLHWQAVSLPLMPAEKPIIRLAGSDITSKDSKFSYLQKKLTHSTNIYWVCTVSNEFFFIVDAVQSQSRVSLFAIPWPQHVQLPCPSLSPGVCSDSCPMSWWCYPTFSSSATHVSFCLQSLQASGPFSKESPLCSRWPKY